jgi:hypothetical protein
MEVVHAASRAERTSRPWIRYALTAAAVILLIYGPAAASIGWLNLQKRSDTRALAAAWLKLNTPRGTRVAVENNGPTYLDSAGFKVTGAELLLDKRVDWYRERVDYLIISAADLGRYSDYVNAGPTVFQVSPTPQRWGPPILVVRLTGH